MNRITVNGRPTDVAGNRVSLREGRLMVDNVVVAEGLCGKVTIEWEGELASLQTDGNVQCGAVSGDVICGGSTNIGQVEGNVMAGGSAHCAEVGGDVQAAGSAHCRTVGGNIVAGGSVSTG